MDFQINGINLALVEGVEVAVTNLNSSSGPDFVRNLHFSFEEDKVASKSPTVREGNTHLKCVYFPIVEGKESIDKILEKLNCNGCGIQEDYESFSRISIRRLGCLLPEARWELLPCVKSRQKKGNKVEILKRNCSRVKCFIDKIVCFTKNLILNTDLAPHDRFTKALKDLGCYTPQKEKVKVQIFRGEKQLTL
ncbi:structural maintenance of chromosomes flexible hinge domain-containing protein GMI1 [Beta vulgaris subsp. vulgaris]|uniref:structural maintenance of chromosomes flexible hinge domain-containing protein GMI1 n=1 Tax=Beta vulgaris subsp. vulgaris TaxID=3555 RepID=UPI000900FEC9|nr:structural maintenance of chromosomes flexible hinge domain-containing protein GMI1 [Beta vulgaris subsp. vulgaris]